MQTPNHHCGSWLAIVLGAVVATTGAPPVARAEIPATLIENPEALLGPRHSAYGPGLDMDGEWLVAGMMRTEVNGSANAGAARFYKKDAAGFWTTAHDVTALAPAKDEFFGSSVAVSGANAFASRRSGAGWAVDAMRLQPDGKFAIVPLTGGTKDLANKWDYEPGPLEARGDFLVIALPDVLVTYIRQGESWAQATLTSLPGSWGGQDIVLLEDELLVARAAVGNYEGGVYVHDWTGSGWALVQTLRPPPAASGGRFATQISCDGSTLGVYWRQEDYLPEPNRICTYERFSGLWELTQVIEAPPADNGPYPSTPAPLFIDNLVVDGDWIHLGRDQPDQPDDYNGIVHSFHRANGTWSLHGSLVPGPVQGFDTFGYLMDSQDGNLVVGAFEEPTSGSNIGVLYSYSVSASGAELRERVDPAEFSSISDWFGQAVAVSGETAVIGVPQDNWRGWKMGGVYVHEQAGEAGEEAQLLKPSDGADGDAFGTAVSIEGDRLVAGAPNSGGMGAAHVFERSAGNWLEVAGLSPSSGAGLMRYGASLSLDGNMLAVGAPNEASVAANNGAVFVHEHDGSAWGSGVMLLSPSAARDEYLGAAVSLCGDRLLASTHLADFGGQEDVGAVRVFSKSGGAWSEEAVLRSPDPRPYDHFGFDVALQGDTAAVGARWADGSGIDEGAVYIFERGPGGWGPGMKLVAPAPEARAFLGLSVDLDGDVLIVGAPGARLQAQERGAVHLFTRSGGDWSHQGVRALQAGAAGDRLGWAVAVDGGRAVVGIPRRPNPVPGAGAVLALDLEYVQLDFSTHGAPGASVSAPSQMAIVGGDPAPVWASEVSGFEFQRWTKDGVEVSTQNPLALQDVQAPGAYVAEYLLVGKPSAIITR